MPPGGTLTKSVHTHSFLHANAPTVVGHAHTKPPRQRLSAALFGLPFSPSSQSAFSSQSAVHSAPVPETFAADCAAERGSFSAPGRRQMRLGHSSAGDDTAAIWPLLP